MTSSADASTSTKNPNPLLDDDLSELTKREILFWARKLKLSPSELFTLPSQDLEQHLERAKQEEYYDEQRKNQYEKWERLSEIKRFLLEEQHMGRLKGGGPPNRRTIWDILCAAANEIESMYDDTQNSSGSGGGSCPYSNVTGSGYESSSFGGFAAPCIPNMCSIIHEMHPEDSHYTPPDFPSTLSATPVDYGSSQRRNATYDVNASCAPRNATFNVPQNSAANATYNVCAPRNATFDMPRAANATYNICPRQNATFDKPRAAVNATYSVCPAQNATFGMSRAAVNATSNVGPTQNATFDMPRSANATYNVCPTQNATFDMPHAATATYNICPPKNTTYNVSREPNAAYGKCPPASNATYSPAHDNANVTYNAPQVRATNATYNICPDATFNALPERNHTFNAATQRGSGNATFKACPRSRPRSPIFRVNPVMASTPKNCPRTGRKPYFRNYTDYWLTLSGLGITEASQSISYDVFSDNKSMVRAASRTYSLPQRSKSCPPSERSRSTPCPVVSGGRIPPHPQGGSRACSPMRSQLAGQGLAATNCGFSPLARPANDRSFGGPRHICTGKMSGFCDCARRSRSVPRC